MTYIIPLSPESLEWLGNQPESTQALVGWTLVNRGVPRDHLERNYDVTPGDLEKMMLLNWGVDYHIHAACHEFQDFYDFIPAPRYPTLLYWFYRALPFIFVFLFGLICGLDWA